MYLNLTVEIPELKTGISRKKIKGTTYIYYEYGRKYYSDKKYTVSQCTSIGKMCEDNPSAMIPNTNYLKFFPDAELPEELPVFPGCRTAGGAACINTERMPEDRILSRDKKGNRVLQA